MREKLYSVPLVRYVLAGGASYILELAALLTLHKAIGLSSGQATAIAFWIGLVAAFLLQKFFAFQDYKKNTQAISRQAGVYLVLILINYLFTIGLVSLFPSRLIVVSRTIALIITTCWNYLIYKKIIFKNNNGQSKKSKGVSLTWSDSIKKFQTAVFSKRSLHFFLLSGLVILFFYQYIATGNSRSLGGDFDYYSQMYEAFRVSVLNFHQFPSWNPWLAGGVPLFANPQFGLFSLQAVLVLVFGGIYGLKLAYVTYALLGFWGMFFLGRRVLEASKIRSALIAYIWVFGGFFAGHSVSHLTFTSFFLLPWLIYFMARRRQKYSWLWLGIVESTIILSSVHYGFLMMTLALIIYFILSLSKISKVKNGISFSVNVTRPDVLFALKAGLTVIVLSGYQLYSTYRFVSHNQRLTSAFGEVPPTLEVIFKAIFLPVGTLLDYPKTTWGWGEYSMYIGLGTGIALLLCIVTMARSYIVKSKQALIHNRAFVWCMVGIGLFGFALALGNFGSLSPFHILHSLPGFTQTRVPSRWLIFTAFAILIFILSWRRNSRAINALLILAVIELFISHGPPRVNGSNQFLVPEANFSSSFTQYDNGLNHLDADQNIMHSYYYTTTQNIGQVYADDSLINTLSSNPPLRTGRCGLNKSPNCAFVMTGNANVSFWSPNKIIIKRMSPGVIELNMNVESGWRVNDVYPFVKIKNLDPARQFLLTTDEPTYTLEYAPKFSPTWVKWRMQKL